MIWDPNILEFDEIAMSAQAIHGIIWIPHLKVKFTLSVIYGFHTIETRKSLWNKLRSMSATMQGS